MKTMAAQPAVALASVISLLALAASCKREVAAAGTAVATTVASASTAATTKPAQATVTKVVFVGKQDACDCTRKRVDDSLAALQTALGDRQDIAVERLQEDIDQARVTRYQQMGAIMVLPGIYLLDGSGAPVEMLQGEVTVEQLRRALGNQ
jgi:hypothetical protein